MSKVTIHIDDAGFELDVTDGNVTFGDLALGIVVQTCPGQWVFAHPGGDPNACATLRVALITLVMDTPAFWTVVQARLMRDDES